MCSFIVTNKEIDDLNYINRYNRLRGPDLTNIVKVNDIYFVHNLLSITGTLTKQPFLDEENEIVGIYNGEIYNHSKFKSNVKSDGECILPGYKKNNRLLFSMLDGEYAIVIIDFKSNKMLWGGDHFTTKPLYYSFDGDKFGIASYSSVLKRLGFNDIKRIRPNTTYEYDLNKFGEVEKYINKTLDIHNQVKKHYDDWSSAFSRSIYKRTDNVRESIFIGLSSGYDSGAIACELLNQRIPFKAYTIEAEEDTEVIQQRINKLNLMSGFNKEYIKLTYDEFNKSKFFLKLNTEEAQYEIYRDQILTKNEYMTEDKGSVGLYHICEKAKQDGYKIYLSGQGADEIFSDYGYRGEKIYNHSTIGGFFPNNLEDVWPWKNFYESTQKSYLSKEENVSGANGIEGRYPFLDYDVVQEFLWLHPDLKNQFYKNVLHNYLINNNFPFKENTKIGFSCDKGLI